jgi:hypothetical protein
MAMLTNKLQKDYAASNLSIHSSCDTDILSTSCKTDSSIAALLQSYNICSGVSIEYDSRDYAKDMDDLIEPYMTFISSMSTSAFHSETNAKSYSESATSKAALASNAATDATNRVAGVQASATAASGSATAASGHANTATTKSSESSTSATAAQKAADDSQKSAADAKNAYSIATTLAKVAEEEAYITFIHLNTTRDILAKIHEYFSRLDNRNGKSGSIMVATIAIQFMNNLNTTVGEDCYTSSAFLHRADPTGV